MDAFLAALLAFPTVCFTSLVGLVIVYWLTVIVGALDIDFLSPDSLHGDVGGDIGSDVGGDVGGDAGEVDADSDVGISGDGVHGLASFISLGKVPVTIIISMFALVGWFLSMFAEMLLRGPIAAIAGDIVYGIAMTPVIAIITFILTAFFVRPFRGMFTLVTEHAGITLHGKMVRVTSRAVSTTFGTAICDNAGAGILMNVICREGATIKRDDMVVVVEYDSAKQTYLVAPFSHTPIDAVDALEASTNTPLPPSTPATPVSLERREEPPH